MGARGGPQGPGRLLRLRDTGADEEEGIDTDKEGGKEGTWLRGEWRNQNQAAFDLVV